MAVLDRPSSWGSPRPSSRSSRYECFRLVCPLCLRRDVLRELRALWENNVSKSGAIGEYVGGPLRREGSAVASGEPVGATLPPAPVPARPTESSIKIEDSIKTEQPDQEEQTEQTNSSGKRPLETSAGAGGDGEKPEKKRQNVGQQDDDDELLGSDLDDSEIGELDDLAGADAAGQVDENNAANSVLGTFERVARYVSFR